MSIATFLTANAGKEALTTVYFTPKIQPPPSDSSTFTKIKTFVTNLIKDNGRTWTGYFHGTKTDKISIQDIIYNRAKLASFQDQIEPSLVAPTTWTDLQESSKKSISWVGRLFGFTNTKEMRIHFIRNLNQDLDNDSYVRAHEKMLTPLEKDNTALPTESWVMKKLTENSARTWLGWMRGTKHTEATIQDIVDGNVRLTFFEKDLKTRLKVDDTQWQQLETEAKKGISLIGRCFGYINAEELQSQFELLAYQAGHLENEEENQRARAVASRPARIPVFSEIGASSISVIQSAYSAHQLVTTGIKSYNSFMEFIAEGNNFIRVANTIPNRRGLFYQGLQNRNLPAKVVFSVLFEAESTLKLQADLKELQDAATKTSEAMTKTFSDINKTINLSLKFIDEFMAAIPMTIALILLINYLFRNHIYFIASSITLQRIMVGTLTQKIIENMGGPARLATLTTDKINTTASIFAKSVGSIAATALDPIIPVPDSFDIQGFPIHEEQEFADRPEELVEPEAGGLPNHQENAAEPEGALENTDID